MKKGKIRLDNKKDNSNPARFKSSNNKFFKDQKFQNGLERIEEEEMHGFSTLNNFETSQIFSIFLSILYLNLKSMIRNFRDLKN